MICQWETLSFVNKRPHTVPEMPPWRHSRWLLWICLCRNALWISHYV